VVELAALAGLAGLLALDATAVAQTMVSQPIVAGATAGLICGEPALGALLGVVLQLVWLGALPVGAAGFPDAPVGTVVGVGTMWLMLRAGGGPGLAVPAGLAVAILVGEIGRAIVRLQRKWNVRLSESALVAADSGEPASGVRRAVATGLASQFLLSATLALVALSVAAIAIRVFAPAAGRAEFPSLIWAAPIAAAVIAQRFGRARERVLMAAGFVVGLILVLGR
jgi:mannose PTS system EIIC component